MKVIQEYILSHGVITPQTLYLPRAAEVVGVRQTDKGLLVITIVNPAEPITELRTFKICSTADTIYTDNIKYIGSYTSEFGIKHIIELT